MREAGLIIGKNHEILYTHTPHDRSGGALPDSTDLWQALWENRENLLGFAHSHPGNGIPGPSFVDITSFDAIERGVGRRLTWWISSSSDTVLIEWAGPDRLHYAAERLQCEPDWVQTLRALSEIRSLPEIAQGDKT